MWHIFCCISVRGDGFGAIIRHIMEEDEGAYGEEAREDRRGV